MTTTEPSHTPARLGREVAVLILAGLGITLVSARIYAGLGLPPTGPMPQRTILLVVLISILLRRGGRRWSEFGLVRTLRWWQLTLAVLLLLTVELLLLQPLSDLIRSALALGQSDYAFFAHIRGNTLALALWLGVAWIAGGFAEEMVFRGWLMGRLAEVAGGGPGGWGAALVVQALLFGAGHAYAGLGTSISATLTALLFGVAYLTARRSLWPVILAHAIWDSLGIIAFYVQGVPGQ